MIEKIKQFKILTGLIILVLVISIPITIIQLRKQQETRSRASGETISVLLDPQTKNIKVTDELDVNVSLNGGQNNISAVDIIFTYSKDLISPFGNGCNPPLMCPQFIGTPFTPSQTFTTIKNDFDYATGTVHYVGVNPTANTISGSSISLGTFKFQAKAEGSATLGFSDIHVNASGVASALPVDTENTKTGTYSITTGEVILTPVVTISATPSPTCTPRPACLDGLLDPSTGQVVICQLAEPIGGYYCPPSPTPTTIVCGGIAGVTCPEGFSCQLNGSYPDAQGTCAPTNSLSPIPTATLVPTGIIVSDATSISISLAVPGIGINTQVGQNPNPLTPQREVTVKLYSSLNIEAGATGMLTFDSVSGQFTGTVQINNNSISGPHTIKLTLGNTLFKSVPGIINISSGTLNQVPPVQLVSGDISPHDNEINLLDYNYLLSCLSETNSCETPEKADLNDDGKIDELDLNIMLSGFSKRQGD